MKNATTPNEQKIKIIALSVSIILHLLLLLFTFPVRTLTIKATPGFYMIPVQMQISKTQTTAKVNKGENAFFKKIKKQKQEPVSAKGYGRKKDKTAKPTETEGMPGDRNAPEINNQNQINPVYPKEALNNNWIGTIIVDFDIDARGCPVGSKIVQSTGHRSLDEAFIRTIMLYYTFKPKRVFGKDLPGKIRLNYTYKLED